MTQPKYFIPASESGMELAMYGVFAVSIGCIACFAWAGAGMMIQKYYEKYYRYINVVLGIMLLYCAARMIF